MYMYVCTHMSSCVHACNVSHTHMCVCMCAFGLFVCLPACRLSVSLFILFGHLFVHSVIHLLVYVFVCLLCFCVIHMCCLFVCSVAAVAAAAAAAAESASGSSGSSGSCGSP